MFDIHIFKTRVDVLPGDATVKNNGLADRVAGKATDISSLCLG